MARKIEHIKRKKRVYNTLKKLKLQSLRKGVKSTIQIIKSNEIAP